MEVAVLDSPQAAPARCYYCGGSSKSSYLDTGIQIEFYGALYFCNECMEFLSQKMGYINPDYAKDLEAKNLYLIHENEELKRKLDSLLNAFKELQGVIQVDLDTDSFLNNPLNNYFGLSESSDPIDGESQEGTRELVTGEKGPSEQTSIEGMADLSSRESNYNPFDL